MNKMTIMGIRVDHRANVAPKVQEILTKYGKIIISRFGIPDSEKKDGLITLYVPGGSEETTELSQELASIEGVTVKTMEL